MSNKNLVMNPLAMSFIQQCNGRPILANNQFGEMQNNLRLLAQSDSDKATSYHDRVAEQVCQSYGFQSRDMNKPFIFSNGIAVVPVHGTLINRFGDSWGYVTGYNYIRRMAGLAAEDPDVELIVYDHMSGGGMVSGGFETHEFLMSLRGKKPSVAVVDHASYSASYMQAVAADKIFVTRTGGVGSIGVWTMHVDMSKLLEDWGLGIELIYSGKHKVDGHPFAALPDDVRKNIQASVDKTRQEFVTLVATSRGLDEKMVYDTEGQTYDAADAVAMGLADGIATPTEAIALMLTGTTEGSTMSQSTAAATTAAPAAAAPAPAAAPAAAAPAAAAPAAAVETGNDKQAERARISAICKSEHAEGRSAMAEHLAFNTDMSADAAIALLQTAPKTAAAPAAAAPATTAPAAAAVATVFENAMNTTANPNVEDENASGGDKSAADTILGDYQRATGIKLDA